MGIFKRLFDFYVRSSIHVAFAVFAMVRITQLIFHIENDQPMALFAFFGTITGYNFVKFDALARVRRKEIPVKTDVKIIAALSFLSFLGAAWCFLQFRLITQLVSITVLVLTALYTLPFFPNRKNARNWAGVKIYIVSLCWVGVTVVLPVLNAGIEITSDLYLKCVQRFILVFVLILIFEIVDLEKDDPHLHTVPQQIGVKQTKIFGLLLLILFCGLEFLKVTSDGIRVIVKLILPLL
ncbi:MAG: hypothetical protein EOO48_02590, partial [Flavobacterium sp.]